VTEIVDGPERAMLVAVRDDALCERGTDTRELLQLVGRCSIHIDRADGRPLLST
jgi:hypothetical protein